MGDISGGRKAMIVTVRADLTWVGVPKQFNEQGEKKFAQSMKDMTGADDVEVIDWNSWDEEEDE
jgi:hypothetical protein